MSRLTRRCAAVAALCAAAVAVSASPAAAKSCDVGNTRSYGTTYVVAITVSGVSCSKGKSVIRAYHRCRAQHGGRNGRCPNRVMRFRCREGARQSVPGVQYSTKVTCRRGGRKIVSTYTQNV